MDWGMIAGSGAGKKMGRAYRQFPPITLSGFPHGLNTSVLPNQIQRTECSELVNFGITRGGQIQTRSPIILHTTAAPVVATKYPVEVSYCPIGSTYRELIVDSAHNLYYNNAGTPTTVGAAPLSGATRILPFAGVAILFDGSYIKYVDGVAANSIKIAYDNGSGPSSYQHNNRTGSDDSGLAVGNGTNTRAAATFTTQSWDAGYTIPPTTFFAFLQRIGNGFTGTDNVPIYARIRRTSDDSIIAAKILVAAPIATNLSATAAEYEITFSASDITTPFLPSTHYRLSIESVLIMLPPRGPPMQLIIPLSPSAPVVLRKHHLGLFITPGYSLPVTLLPPVSVIFLIFLFLTGPPPMLPVMLVPLMTTPTVTQSAPLSPFITSYMYSARRRNHLSAN